MREGSEWFRTKVLAELIRPPSKGRHRVCISTYSPGRRATISRASATNSTVYGLREMCKRKLVICRWIGRESVMRYLCTEMNVQLVLYEWEMQAEDRMQSESMSAGKFVIGASNAWATSRRSGVGGRSVLRGYVQR